MSGAFQVTGIQHPAKKWVEDFGEGWVQFKAKGLKEYGMILAHVGPHDPTVFWNSIRVKIITTFGMANFHEYLDSGFLVLTVNTWKRETPQVPQTCPPLSYLQKRVVFEVLFENKDLWRPGNYV
ncbi:uncharacterized protein G6M90_00g077740 [Metarhizium brunneum]|uniref:Uncharacterized protein n=1 Tax=Metarhizium brunneum TaxID=500148 RepID=A0A7D5V1D7_9HYPO